MSKQSESKEKQFYTPKLVPSVCSNCFYFRSNTVTMKGVFGDTYKRAKNLRCDLGGFAVRRMGSCSEWKGIA